MGLQGALFPPLSSCFLFLRVIMLSTNAVTVVVAFSYEAMKVAVFLYKNKGMTPGMKEQNDHDLLIELNANVVNLAATVNAYITSANKKTDDHEIRLRNVESNNQQLKGAQKSQKTMIAALGCFVGLCGLLLGILEFLR